MLFRSFEAANSSNIRKPMLCRVESYSSPGLPRPIIKRFLLRLRTGDWKPLTLIADSLFGMGELTGESFKISARRESEILLIMLKELLDMYSAVCRISFRLERPPESNIPFDEYMIVLQRNILTRRSMMMVYQENPWFRCSRKHANV